MVAEPTIYKQFRNWRGLNKAFPDRARPPGFSDIAENVEIDRDFDATKRPGFDMLSHAGTSGGAGLFGLANYVRYDEDSGTTEEELFCLDNSQQGVRLTPHTLTITYSGGNTSTFTFKPNSSNVWEADIKENGSSISGWPKTYGDGTEITTSSGNALSQLVTDITAESDYSATATQTVGLAGSGLLPAGVLPLTINGDMSGGTLVLNYLGPERVEVAGNETMEYPGLGATQSWHVLPNFQNPSSVSMKNSLYVANGDFLFKYDSHAFYRAGLPNPNSKPTQSGTGSASITGKYRHSYTYIKVDKTGRRYESAMSPDAVITVSSVAQFNLGFPVINLATMVGAATGSGSSVNTITVLRDADSSPGLASLKVGDQITIAATSAFLPTRNVTSIAYPSTTTATITFDGSAISYASGALISSTQNGELKFDTRQARITVTDTGVNTFTVDTGHTLVVGDVAYFYDDSIDNFIERNVTATTATTITVDGDACDVTTSFPYISNNTRIGIYRTKTGGSFKYLVAEIPAPYAEQTSGRTLFTDNLPDASLGDLYIAPERIPGPPPRCQFIIAHQGLLVAGGDPLNPNRVYWCEPNNPEIWPNEATNYFDIEFTSAGVMSGLAIDNGTLVVFKDKARAYLRGELALDSYSVQVVEDGIGCPGHHSIAQTPQGLIWLSYEGFQRMFNGALDPEFNVRLAIDFKNQYYPQVDQESIDSDNQAKFVFRRAAAINDSRKDKYICFVPCESGVVGNATASSDKKRPNENSVTYVYDYQNDHWSTEPTETYTTASANSALNAFGGYAIHKDGLYKLSMTGEEISSVVERTGFLVKELSRGDEYDYADNTQPITCKASTEWQTGDEPSVFIKVLRYKLHIDDNSLIPAAFTLTVRRYRNFNSTVVNSVDKSVTTSTKEINGKLVYYKSKAEKLEFSNANLHEPFRLTGYEYELLAPYNRRLNR